MKYIDILLHENKKLAYLVILRNGSRIAREVLVHSGFKHYTTFKGVTFKYAAEDLDKAFLDNLEECFCHIRPPKERIIRGVAAAINSSNTLKYQFLKVNHKNYDSSVINGYFESDPIAWLKFFHDYHLYPVSYHYSDFLDKLYPLALTKDWDIGYTTELYIKGKDIKLKKPIEQRYVTTGDFLEVQEKVREIVNSPLGNQFYMEFLLPWYQEDLNLFKLAVENTKRLKNLFDET